MMERYTFDDMWESLKNEDEESRIAFETAEDISRVIVELIEARVERGFTQHQLAEKTGLKQSAIARMESLKSIPRLDTIVKVANALKVRISVDRASAKIVGLTAAITAMSTNDNRYNYYGNTPGVMQGGISNGVAS